MSVRNAEGHITEECDIRRQFIDAFVDSRRLQGYERTRGSMRPGDGVRGLTCFDVVFEIVRVDVDE